MWPWGHAAVGYVVYTVLSIPARRRPPTTVEAAVVIFGTQLPDLVDKPLSWTFGVLPSGRSLGHSLLTWVVAAVLVVAVARRLDRRDFAPALLVGYLVGILTDVPSSVFAGDLSRGTFLAWPVLPPPAYDAEPSMAAHLAELGTGDVVRLLVIAFVLVVGHVLLSLATWSNREYARESS